MGEIEIGYCLVGFIGLVSVIGSLCIIIDSILNKEKSHIEVNNKQERIDWAEFIKD